MFLFPTSTVMVCFLQETDLAFLLYQVVKRFYADNSFAAAESWNVSVPDSQKHSPYLLSRSRSEFSRCLTRLPGAGWFHPFPQASPSRCFASNPLCPRTPGHTGSVSALKLQFRPSCPDSFSVWGLSVRLCPRAPRFRPVSLASLPSFAPRLPGSV